MSKSKPNLSLNTLASSRYGWPLRQLRIPQAHKITTGRKDVVVAVIDLGYQPHPEHKGHLWIDPDPKAGGTPGWDCCDDATLANTWTPMDNPNINTHQGFVVGQVIACAPGCRVMVVRVGYSNPDSWWRGIEYAVEHGAKVLAIPHGYLPCSPESSVPLFHRGTDFSYPTENPRIRRALDAAYDGGCLVLRGAADNRSRRAAAAMSAVDSVITVGSNNHLGKAADISISCDYVEVAAPSGQRYSGNPLHEVWSTKGPEGFGSFTGGCMACGFAAGVAALACSRFPAIPNGQIRQILRNTASNDEWDDRLGWGILNAAAAVGLQDDQVRQDVRIVAKHCSLRGKRRQMLNVALKNRGVLDVAKAMVVAFNGNPRKAARPKATLENPELLVTRQVGHTILPVRGLHGATAEIKLTERIDPAKGLWVQLCTLDRHGSEDVQTLRIRPKE